MTDKYCYGHCAFLPIGSFDLIREHNPQLCKKCNEEVKQKQAKADAKARKVIYDATIDKTKKATKEESDEAAKEKVGNRRKIEIYLDNRARREDIEL